MHVFLNLSADVIHGSSQTFAYLSHVFLGGLDDLVVDDPLRLAVEERGGGVDRGDLAVHQGAVTLLQGVTYLPLKV